MSESQAARDLRRGLPASPTALRAALLVLAVGTSIAVWLVHHKLELTHGVAEGASACNFGEGMDCDKVNTSSWSNLFGLPVALYAIPTYLMMAYLLITGLRALKADRDDEEAQATREAGRVGLTLAAGIGLLTVFHSILLAFVAFFEIGSACIFCMSLYAVNLIATGVALACGPARVHGEQAGSSALARFFRAIGRALAGSLNAVFELRSPVLPALGVLVITSGVSWVGYDMANEGLREEARAKARAPYAGPVGGGEAPANVHAAPLVPLDDDAATRPAEPERPAAPAAPVVAPEPKPAAPARVVPREPPRTSPSAPPRARPPAGAGGRPSFDPRQSKRGGEKTKDGWTYFETPVDEANEFWFGNPKAKVTVVKFADFQCAYCSMLARSMKPVMEDYKDRVRFVMRNFPMNGKCNPPMRDYDKHPYACEASYAAHCAGLQGKFWEMHDKLYEDQEDIEPAALPRFAEEVGLDKTRFQACMKDPATVAAIKQEIQVGYQAGLQGTPRTYIANRMVTGASSRSILEYHLKLALRAAAGKQPAAPGTTVEAAPKPDGRSMIAVKLAKNTVFIDPYEAAITKDGKAVSIPDVEPAQANWMQAKAACEAAGKRLCSEQEWISACTGQAAVDRNNNGWFSDEAPDGNMYPYGPYYLPGACHDQGDKYEGRPIATGSKAKCRTAAGAYDLAGNISEWVNDDRKRATLMGGFASSGQGAACNRRSYGSGVGKINHTTGFRCCADSNVRQDAVGKEDLRGRADGLMGHKVPAIEVKDTDGKAITSKDFLGKVTLVNFFAKWCGPCKKELPFLVRHQKQYGPKGFRVIGIGVDSQQQASIDFAKEYGANFSIVTDPEQVLMGEFRVYTMPATFIVDRQGVVRYSDTGFKPEQQAAKLEQAIRDLLGK